MISLFFAVVAVLIAGRLAAPLGKTKQEAVPQNTVQSQPTAVTKIGANRQHQAITEHHKHNRESEFKWLLSAWARVDPIGAASYAKADGFSGLRRQNTAVLAQGDFAALTWIEALPDEHLCAEGKRHFATHLDKTDPAAAKE